MKINISLSAAIDRYMEMFNGILPLLSESEALVKGRVKDILQLKKQDRIIWLCNVFRLMLAAMLHQRKKDNGLYEELCKKLKIHNIADLHDVDIENMDFYDVLGSIDSLVDAYKHWYSLNLPKINSYIFENNESSHLSSDYFAQIEDDWKSKTKGSVPEYGKKIIEFADGSAWWDLEKEYCKIEGKAMGHCGNAGDPQRGDRVLSYRVPTADGNWKPLLTFILSKHRRLGEMKGRGNDKPLPKFHPVIIKLIESSIVRGIEGGGYLPENNFDISDLDISNLAKLKQLDKYPKLFTYETVINLLKKDQAEFVPEGITIEDDLNLSDCFNLSELPYGLKVYGSLDISYTAIEKLPELLFVQDELIAKFTRITELPKRLRVGDNIILDSSKISSLPKGFTVQSNLSLRDTSISQLPEAMTIGYLLDLQNSQVAQLPDKLKVHVLDIRRTKIASLPDDLKVGLAVIAKKDQLVYIPKHLQDKIRIK